MLTAGELMVRNDDRLQLRKTNLLLKNVTKEDAGEYECEVESDRKVLQIQKTQLFKTSKSRSNVKAKVRSYVSSIEKPLEMPY